MEEELTQEQIELMQKKESLAFYKSEVVRNQTMVDELEVEIAAL